jgi:cation:H+ antiporter
LFLDILLSIIGFALLIKCADVFVSGAVSFAKNLKIPTLVIGLTIVAFGTSAPELAISFSSHISGNTDMMFGNVIGSSISNVFVIMGVAVLIIPMKIGNNVVKKEIPILMLITLGLSVLFLDATFYGSGYNMLSRTDGIILILFFAIFVYYLISLIKNSKDENDEKTTKPKHKIPLSVVMIILGLGGIIFGSDLVVDNVAALAEDIGISQKIISVTVVSIGTSLPELVTIIAAARKGENSMAVGSIVGGNIFNICIVLGLPVIFLGQATTSSFGIVDAAFMVAAVLLLWVFSATNRKLKRYEGIVLIGMYCLYAGYIFLQ